MQYSWVVHQVQNKSGKFIEALFAYFTQYLMDKTVEDNLQDNNLIK
jgi:hypothetical protein